MPQCTYCREERSDLKMFDTSAMLFCTLEHFKSFHKKRIPILDIESTMKLIVDAHSPSFLADKGEFDSMEFEAGQQWIKDVNKLYDTLKHAATEAQKRVNKKIQMKLDADAVAGIDRRSTTDVKREKRSLNEMQKLIAQAQRFGFPEFSMLADYVRELMKPGHPNRVVTDEQIKIEMERMK